MMNHAVCFPTGKHFITPLTIWRRVIVVIMFLFDHYPLTTIRKKEVLESTSILLENLEEIFPQYYVHSEVFNIFMSPTTQ